jgi:hypothetical protein
VEYLPSGLLPERLLSLLMDARAGLRAMRVFLVCFVANAAAWILLYLKADEAHWSADPPRGHVPCGSWIPSGQRRECFKLLRRTSVIDEIKPQALRCCYRK